MGLPTALDLTGRRIHWVSVVLATVFVLFGLFFHFSQQSLLQSITASKLSGVQALSDVGFTINHGEIYGLIGPNGAGKTSLFHVLTGGSPRGSSRTRRRST
jgi:ABC-type polysaccharide/polyol phosphate transport system ATPase subunit